MASLNKCLFIGNLTADPEIRTMPNGDQVANFSIALNEKYKAKDGNIVENVEYVRIVIYRKLAEIAAQYLHKGSQVYIEGRLKTRKWQDNNGQDRYSTEIQCDNLQMLGGRNQDAAQNQPPKQQDKQQKAQSKPQQSEPPMDAFDDNIPF
jgi:single-strand DNA-binding protein